jgi:hypothetical protein
MSAPTILEHGGKCYGVLDDGQHGDRCHCGRPATRHVYFGTGCGNVCGIHARGVLRIKRMSAQPPNLVELPRTRSHR